MIQYSATQLALLEACPRKWWYGYVAKIKSPASAGQVIGSAIHNEAEAIGKGARPEPTEHSHRVKAALRELARLEAERSQWQADRVAEAARDPVAWFEGWAKDPAVHLEIPINLELPNLPEVDGPRGLIGFVDILDGRRPQAPRILDYKTMKSIKYLRTENELAHDSQLSIYAYWATQVAPEAEVIEVGHIGIQTQGAANVQSSLAILDRNTVEQRWTNRFLPVFQQADLEYRNKPTAGEVPAKGETNGECDRYGGCFYRSICKTASIFGAEKGTDTVAIDFKARIADLKAKAGGAQAPAQAAPAQAAPAQAAPAQAAPAQAAPAQVSIFEKLKAKASAPTEAEIDQRVDAVLAQAPTTPAPLSALAALAKLKGAQPQAPAKVEAKAPAPAKVEAQPIEPGPHDHLPGAVTHRGLVLFVDCEPDNTDPFGQVQYLEEVMAPICDQIKAATGKRWQQHSYREGPALLVEGLSQLPLSGGLIVDSDSPIAQQVMEGLLPRAAYVVRGR